MTDLDELKSLVWRMEDRTPEELAKLTISNWKHLTQDTKIELFGTHLRPSVEELTAYFERAR